MRVWDSGWQHINTAFKSLLPELRSLIKVDKTPRAIIFGVEGLSPSVVPNFILFICLKNWKTTLLVILKKKSKKISKKKNPGYYIKDIHTYPKPNITIYSKKDNKLIKSCVFLNTTGKYNL